MSRFRSGTLASALALATVFAGSAAWADVTIGAAFVLSGGNAPYGLQERRGVEAAVEAINAAGGVNGEKIVVEFGDDAGDPRQAVQVANDMVNKKVAMVVGHTLSGATVAAAPVYDEEGIIMITPSATAVDLTEKGYKTVFRTVVRDDQQGKVAGAYIAQNFKDKKIAFVQDSTTYGKGLADATRAVVNAAGVKETAYETITPGELDYSATISKLKAQNIDVVYYGGLYNEAGLLLRQMRDQGLKAQFISGDGLYAQDFWSIVGPAGEGVLLTIDNPPETNPAAKDVVAALKAKNIDPAGYTLYAYAAVQAWAEAAKKAGSTDPEKVAAALHDGSDYKTVLGDIAYDAKGDRTKSGYALFKRTGTTFEPAK
jgi:branched-chain amino acid transport system substrate-binding protein